MSFFNGSVTYTVHLLLQSNFCLDEHVDFVLLSLKVVQNLLMSFLQGTFLSVQRSDGFIQNTHLLRQVLHLHVEEKQKPTVQYLLFGMQPNKGASRSGRSTLFSTPCRSFSTLARVISKSSTSLFSDRASSSSRRFLDVSFALTSSSSSKRSCNSFSLDCWEILD